MYHKGTDSERQIRGLGAPGARGRGAAGRVLPFLRGPMDFSLSDDQRLLKDTIRQFMEAEVRPHLRKC